MCGISIKFLELDLRVIVLAFLINNHHNYRGANPNMHFKVKRNLELNPFPDGQPVKKNWCTGIDCKTNFCANLSSSHHDLIELYIGKY